MYKRKHKIRHNILKVLQQRQDTVYADFEGFKTISNIEIAMGIDELSEKTQYTKEEITAEVEILVDRHQLTVITEDAKPNYYVTRIGSVAYYDKQHLDDGKKSLLTQVKDYVGIITAIGLFVIAVYTFISNIVETKQNARDLDTIKIRLDRINNKLK
ncbi:MAG: hypothetical protein AB7O73_08870 [Bacteroidia bacterium]